MSLTVTSVGNNPQTPGVNAEVYIPDQLIAGNMKLVTDTVTLGAGTLARGAVLGKITASGNYVLSVATANDGSGPSGTCWNVRPAPARSPRNTLIPSMPSRPTVATSTSPPSRI